jgi:hypothetical protein
MEKGQPACVSRSMYPPAGFLFGSARSETKRSGLTARSDGDLRNEIPHSTPDDAAGPIRHSIAERNSGRPRGEHRIVIQIDSLRFSQRLRDWDRYDVGRL